MCDLSKRYFVFVYESYYPLGGMKDLKITSNDFIECVKFITEYEWNCTGGFQIYNTEEKRIVKGRKTHTELLWGDE